jgi:ATP-binding cassette subfamily F protein 3
MFVVSALSKSYYHQPVLRDVSFALNPGERLGLVGPNGSGKSTLLRLLAGELRPDSGSVRLAPGERVAYLPQYPQDELDLPVRESLLCGVGPVAELERRIEGLERALSAAGGEALQPLLAEYAAARDEHERLGGYELDARIGAVLDGLGLGAPLDTPVRALSGGMKTKLSLARLLLAGASVLLLDEPTNYLDLPALLWLERFVTQGDRSYLIVSHDRRFLDRTVTGILELLPEEHTVRSWPGDYTAYAQAKEKEREKQLEAYLLQRAERRRIEEDIRRTKEQANRTQKETQHDYIRARAKKVAAKAKARETRLERMLSSEDQVEKPGRSWGLNLGDLGEARAHTIEDDRTVLEVSGLRAGYGGREVLRGADLLLRGRDRVALLGPNGSGKSTLLGCVTGRVPHGGAARLGSGVRLGALSQEGDELQLDATVLDLFRARTRMYEDEARAQLHRFLFAGDEVFKPVRALSYGQRAKLALAMLVLSDANFLALDEPTSHMDLQALEAVEGALAAYRGPLLVVSHDRYFLDRIGINRVETLEAGRLRPVESVEAYEREALAHA